MIKEIYEFIEKFQKEIGNDAEVKFSIEDEMLIIRVDWRREDFHSRHTVSKREFSRVDYEGLITARLVEMFRREYSAMKEMKTEG